MLKHAAIRGLVAGAAGVAAMTAAEKLEQLFTRLHKGIYAFVAGAVADRLIAGPPSTVVRREGSPGPLARCGFLSREEGVV